jgi:hypothetical protein
MVYGAQLVTRLAFWAQSTTGLMRVAIGRAGPAIVAEAAAPLTLAGFDGPAQTLRIDLSRAHTSDAYPSVL